jgi:competence protein ComEA
MNVDVSTSTDPRAEMEALGYDVVYKPHDVMADYNAFYRVEYDDTEIAPPAARRMDVPLNEVWLTELLRPYEKYVLYHELNEVKSRAEGYGVERAHELAVEADKAWEGDPKWEELQHEINLTPPERVCQLDGFDRDLFDRIQNHRPYCDMAELRDVPGIDQERHDRLTETFWCFDCDL